MRFKPSQVADGLFIGLLPDRAGIDYDDISLFSLPGRHETFFREFGIYLQAVQVVHLASIGEYLDVFFHGPSIYPSVEGSQVVLIPVEEHHVIPYCNIWILPISYGESYVKGDRV
jgi:hypothetical protein